MLNVREDVVTFDDVLLVPNYSSVLPKETLLNTKVTEKININIPLVSSAMDTVTESRLSIALAQEGGIGIIHRNMSIKNQSSEVNRVKRFKNGIITDLVTADYDTKIRDLLYISEKYHFSDIPVIKKNILLGSVTLRDIRFAKDLEQPVSTIMTSKKQLFTCPEGNKSEDLHALMCKNRIKKVFVVKSNEELVGLVRLKDVQNNINNPLACKDSNGRLLVGAAVGVSKDFEARVNALIDAGADLIVLDSAHGYSKSVLNCIRSIRSEYKNLQIIAGNIATGEAALALVQAGANGVKVGIGPGSICTTRIVSGVGFPQLSAISDVAKALKGLNIPIMADGGIIYSGDVCKAIASGVSTVMIGSLFAGTDEAPGKTELFQGRSYKSYRGMGSLGVMSQGASDRYFQTEVEVKKLVPEGVEGCVHYKGKLSSVIHQILGGLRSGMGYVGCKTISDMQIKTKFVRVSSACFNENHVHNILVTKEPPNYPVK